MEPVALATIYDTVLAVRRGDVRWAVVPIENSLDGSVTVTLDLLADERGDLEIVGEVLLAVRHSLIAAEMVALSEIDTVISHPQVPGQCTRLLRGELARARVLPASSTAEAVRLVATERRPGQAALGTRLAADIYGATVVREGVQDRDDNVTRFVWLARRPHAPSGPQAPPAAPRLNGASPLTRSAPPRGRRDGRVGRRAREDRRTRRQVEDVRGLLGFWRGEPRLAGAVPGRVRPAGDQPDEDRVAPAAGAAWATTSSSPTSRAAPRTAGGAGAGRLARSLRRGSCARLLPREPDLGKHLDSASSVHSR